MRKKNDGQQNKERESKITPKSMAKQSPDQIPVADYKGILKILDAEIQCFVLNDGRRVLSGRAVTNALGLKGRGPGVDRFLLAKSLQPYIDDKLKLILETPIEFQIDAGIVQPLGYEASVLPELCNAVIEAYENGNLRKNQQQMVKPARILLRGFAKVGIIALVDEATGYQFDRKKDALRLLIQSYIIEEARNWMKEFPDEFFVELDRIYNNPPTVPQKRPKYYGRFINKYIYEPIANGLVLEKLKELNPADKRGARRKRLHQFLNEAKGIQVLRNRIGKITALLQISPTKRRYEENFNRMESKQLSFDFPEE